MKKFYTNLFPLELFRTEMNDTSVVVEDPYGECAEAWAYKGQIVNGYCIDDPREEGKAICSITENFDRDRKLRMCTKASGWFSRTFYFPNKLSLISSWF